MPLPTLAFTALQGMTPAQAVAVAGEAQQWGYKAFWGAEVDGPDAFTLLAAIAATTDLDIGVAVVPVQTRTAFVLAMSALSLDSLSGGRFQLGLGASSEVLVERFGGVPYQKPLTWVRETIEALRPALRGERSSIDGEFVRMGGYKSPVAPTGEIPILLGSLNTGSLRLAGKIADGICLNQFGSRHVQPMLAEVRKGAADVGRDLPEDFPVVARLFCAVTDQPENIKAFIPHIFAPYVAVSGYNRFYSWMGFEAQAAAIAEAAKTNDKAAMAAAYSAEIVDELFLVGDVAHVVDRIEEFGEAGVTVASVTPLAVDEEGNRDTLRQVGLEWRRRHG
jgi:probable F420-dependent oxidoreductase